MRLSTRLIAGGGLAVCAAIAHADVTVNATTAGKASFINVGGDGVTQIKGNRMRTEQAVGGKTQALIIDIDGKRFINLDVEKNYIRLNMPEQVKQLHAVFGFCHHLDVLAA